MTSHPHRFLPALLALGMLVSSTSSSLAQQSGLTAETWNNLTQGTSVVILQKEGISTRAPDSTAVTGAQVSGLLGARKGMRMRGSITPTVTDTYTFWISGTDDVALWVSEDGSRFNKKLVAYNLGSTNLGEWDKHANQKSLPIQLTGGQTYYLEAQVMDYDGGGHVSVAWRGQNGRFALNLNGATATQSSTQWNLTATNAIDGKTGGTWNEASLTTNVPNSWLQVDLGQDRDINQVVLYNISQNQNRLSNFRLSVLDVNNVELVGENFFTTSGNVGNNMTWNLPSTVSGVRKVKVQLLGNNLAGNGHLSLAEIEVYGAGLVTGQINHREIIPSTYLTTIQSDPDDTNDNCLSDAWETQTGLSVSSLPGAHLEYGDPDNDGLSNFQEQWFGSNPLSKEVVSDGLTRYIWMGINGSSMSNLISTKSFYGHPNSVTHVPGVDDVLNRTLFGARYRGVVVAPVTGDYRFWVSGSGGGAELWLADGSIQPPSASQPLTNRFGKKRIATSGYITPLHDFDYSATQRSQLIHLVQGQTYYIEALHAQQNGADHISVAWQVPGQARVIIPATAFESDIPEDSDADNDNLPDAWETSVALSTTDNGYTDLKQGEFGDFDGDSLTNLQEYQYGTNPKNADSDGDGYSDGDEILLYQSNPTVSNLLNPVTITLPATTAYNSNTTGAWTTNSNGTLTASSYRGTISYTFTVTNPGVHEVSIMAGLIAPSPWMSQNLPIVLSIDDEEPFASKTLSCKNLVAQNMRAVTPWLTAGTHTINILHDNVNATQRMRLDSVTIKRLGGADLDEDGIPDWIEANITLENALTRVPTQSRTSPVSIEGITQMLSKTTIGVLAPGSQQAQSVTLNTSINDSFYADVPLSEAGAVTLNASFFDGLATQNETIEWIATNLFEDFSNDTLHIRAGDAMRLDAWSGSAADGQPFTVTLNGTLMQGPNQTTVFTSGEPLTATFNTAGIYTLVATHASQTATVTVNVHTANFGSEHVVRAGIARIWTPTQLDSYAQVENDDRLVVSETTGTTGARKFLVRTEEPINTHVIARLPDNVDGAPSAVLSRGTVHAFDFANVDETKDSQIITRYADGTWLVTNTIVGLNLPSNVSLKLFLNNQGSLFANGTTTMWLDADDFDANGIATVYYEWDGVSTTKVCHKATVYITQ